MTPGPQRPADRSKGDARATAWAVITGGRVRIWRDPERILTLEPALLEYAGVADRADLENVDFVLLSDTNGFLHVSISRSAREIATREVIVQSADVRGLTRRELEVLTLMAGGLTNPEIARLLTNQPRTIGTHVVRILAKLGQTTRAGAVAAAVELDLMCLPLPARLTGELDHLRIGALHRGLSTSAGHLGPIFPRRRPIRPPILVASITANRATSSDADDIQKGAELAVAQVNGRGGVAGRSIEHLSITCDIASFEAMSGALEHVADEGVDAVVFGYFEQMHMIAPLLEQSTTYGIPLLHASASPEAEQFVADSPVHLRSSFQLCGPYDYYFNGFARFIQRAYERGEWRPAGRRICVVEAFGSIRMCSDEAASRVEQDGWILETISVEHSESTATQAARIFGSLIQNMPDAILLSTFDKEEVLIEVLRLLRASDCAALVYVIYTPCVPGFVEAAGPAADGVFWSTMSGRYSDAIGRSFESSFVRAFSRRPGLVQAGIHYDAINLLERAWSATQSPADHSSVIAALRREPFRGVNGPYWLGGAGQTTPAYPFDTRDASLGKTQLVYQIRGGVHRLVAPKALSDAVPATFPTAR